MKNRIAELREARGWTQLELAEMVGVGWQTISRIENDHSQITKKREIALSQAFGLDPEDLYHAPGDLSGMRRVTVTQAVKAGYFAESLAWADDDTYEVAVPDAVGLRHIEFHGAEVAGRSMNKIYPEGTVLVYAPFSGQLEVQRRYIVERVRRDGLRESTVKTLTADGAGDLWLIPESTDPEFRPLRVGGEDGETITIVGRVRYAVIPQ